MVGVEPRVDTPQIVQTLDHQRRADEENESADELRNDERTLIEARTAGDTRARRAAHEAAAKIDA